jgi:methionyl-tRNA formyltransferase
MRILFMGTPEPAAKCLKALIDSKEEIIAVITQPDRPKGRGLKLAPSPVKETALHYNIAVHQPEKIKTQEAIDLIKNLKPDLIVVVAYGKILPKEIIDTPEYGTINVHASLLPEYRGAAPIQWALLNGDKETGITIMKVIEELDAGDIIIQKNIRIEDSDNTSTLTEKLFNEGAALLMETVKKIGSGKATYIKQDEKKVTYAPSIEKEMGLIDWKKSARDIYNQIRACNPWPVAYTYLNGKMFRIFSAEIGLADKNDRPGTIVDLAKENGFIVASGDGTLLIKEAQIEAGKKMNAWDLVNGRKIKIGDVLPNREV